MEELFETLVQTCAWEDVATIEAATDKLGFNYFRILNYSQTDNEAKNYLKLCVNLCKARIFEKFYYGTIAKKEADRLICELDDVEQIYLNVSTQPVDEIGD